MNNYNDQRFHSPPMGFQPRQNSQSTPREKFHQNNHFQRSPHPRSPGYSNQHNMHIPRNTSPYQGYRNHSKSFNTSGTSSPEQWNMHSNHSFSSNSSSSYYGDISQLSPYNSPNRNNGSPYYQQNRNKRFQGNRSFQSPDASDSNPGHSNDIRHYVHPSMLEDPWKDLMAEEPAALF